MRGSAIGRTAGAAVVGACLLAAGAAADGGGGAGEAAAPGAGVEAVGARRQDDDDAVVLELRVTALLEGRRVAVDRGARDGLAVGDAVWLLPRDGGRHRAVVRAVEERTAVVELLAADLVPEPGLRGEVLVPAERLAALAAAGGPTERQVAPPPARDDGRPAPDWSRSDDGFTHDQPLLAGLRPVRPEERAPLLTGRTFVAADGTLTTDDGRSETFARLGAELAYENPFGRGGLLELRFEADHRRFDRPELDDLTESALRFERLSYRLGGTRFARDGWRFGRFLQGGLPEFGVLDGVEWGRRVDEHHAFGFSGGFQPEPDAEYESGHDFQLAGWYRWTSDATEVAAVQVGYQKSWHDGAADRDLFVAKAHHLPRLGWQTTATAWVDVYTGGDDPKGSGPEVTQLLVTTSPYTGRRFGLDLSYAFQRYPYTQRDEVLPPVLPEQLADERVHRFGADGWLPLAEGVRAVGRAGLWDDADEDGGDAELGLELRRVAGPVSRVRVTGFVTEGEFTNAWGARAGLAAGTERFGFDLFYELGNYDQRGFEDENDDFVQQRLRLAATWRPSERLFVSAYADGSEFNGERGVAAGVFAQWSF